MSDENTSAADVAEPEKTIEQWRDQLHTSAFDFAIGKAFASWPAGKVVTEKQYLAAIEAAGKVKFK
mgnify:CR=1 FL=1